MIVPTSSVPEDVPGPVQGPLVGVYVDELLDFSQVGILVGLLKPLADAGIPVLTVSTYDTDWVLLEASRGRRRDLGLAGGGLPGGRRRP